MRSIERWRAVVWGYAWGCAVGAIVTVPLWVWLAAPAPGATGPAARWDAGRGAMLMPLVFLGGVIGVGVGKLRTTLPARWRRLLRRGLLWVGGCSAATALLLGWLLLRLRLFGGRFDLDFLDYVGPVLLAATFAAALGFFLIGESSEAAEQDEQAALGQRLAELHRRRAVLESAIEGKFGPLDESRRERLRSWDERRVIEAARKLPGAMSAEELGA